MKPKKKDLLSAPVCHIDYTAFDARPLIDAYAQMSFTAGELARAAEIYNLALDDPDCTVILTLAGSTSAAGCLHVWRDLIRHGMVDAVVATGASIVDMDFFESLGFRHFRAPDRTDVSDATLHSLLIDRIYDTYIDEEALRLCDEAVLELADTLPTGPMSSRAFVARMGDWLQDGRIKTDGGLITEACKAGVPVFCPAFSDSSAGFGLVKHQTQRIEKKRPYVSIDSVADFRELTHIKMRAPASALFMVGGGVPKNFAQDTVICAEFLGMDATPMHRYAVQVTVADPRDGSCSSSTLREARSWGKIETSYEQMVFAEAAMAVPLIASDAYHRGKDKNRHRPARRWQDIF